MRETYIFDPFPFISGEKKAIKEIRELQEDQSLITDDLLYCLVEIQKNEIPVSLFDIIRLLELRNYAAEAIETIDSFLGYFDSKDIEKDPDWQDQNYKEISIPSE